MRVWLCRRLDPAELQRRREEMVAHAEAHGRDRQQRLRRHEVSWPHPLNQCSLLIRQCCSVHRPMRRRRNSCGPERSHPGTSSSETDSSTPEVLMVQETCTILLLTPRPLRESAVSSSHSLEDRIHRSIGSIQRTSAKLNAHFMSK